MAAINIYCVIDCSGSMADCADDTLIGINAFVRNSEPDSRMSLYLFNNIVTTVYENVQVDMTEPLTSTKYRPNGATALLDAIGNTIKIAEKAQPTSWADSDDNSKTIIVILTDGNENASTKYTKPHINDLIANKKMLGWSFVFMGANQDAIKTATELNISEESSITFNTQNVENVLRSASHAVHRSMTTPGTPIEFSQLERASSIV